MLLQAHGLSLPFKLIESFEHYRHTLQYAVHIACRPILVLIWD